MPSIRDILCKHSSDEQSASSTNFTQNSLPYKRLKYLFFIGGFQLETPLLARSSSPAKGKTNMQGVTQRKSRLSWLTNSTLVYEPKCGGGELRGLSQ